MPSVLRFRSNKQRNKKRKENYFRTSLNLLSHTYTDTEVFLDDNCREIFRHGQLRAGPKLLETNCLRPS